MDPEKKLPPEEDDEAAAADEPIEEPDEAKAEVDEMADAKPSARFVASVHSAMTELVGLIEAGESQVENPEIVELIGTLKEQLAAVLADLETSFSSVSDGKSLPKAKPDESDEEAMKAFVALGGGRALRLSGFASQLGRLGKAKNLTAAQKATLLSVQTQLDRCRAEGLKTKRKTIETPAADPLADLKVTFSKLKTDLASLTPRAT